MKKVIVIGGGAGGLMAAIEAGRTGAQVTILEKANRVGKKLLKTGNGRCNLSNENISPEGYNCPEFVAPVLGAFSCRELRAFYQSIGLVTVSDAEGRVYPRSDSATSVLDILRLAAVESGAEEVCSAEVTEIIPQNGSFQVNTAAGESFSADKVILACGGGESLTKKLGLKTVPYLPVLCPLKTDTSKIRGLSGLRAAALVNLLRNGKTIYAEQGEVLFRDYGVSGIVTLNMSRYAQKGDVLSLNLLPEQTAEETLAMLRSQPRQGTDILTGIFHRRLAEALYGAARSTEAEALARCIRDFRLPVLGCGDTANAQVTRGGLSTEDFHTDTMECKKIPGLYAVGEVLDVDGRCGGYNLHWAFSSGRCAGRSACLD